MPEYSMDSEQRMFDVESLAQSLKRCAISRVDAQCG